jgi:hypothetical protein
MKKIIITITLGVLMSSAVLAQSQNGKLSKKEKRAQNIAKEQIYRSNSIGLAYNNLQNTVVTPLAYSGIGIALGTHSRKLLNNKLTFFEMGIRYNSLKAINSNGSTDAAGAQWSYNYLPKLIKKNWFIGGMADINFNYRIAAELKNNAIQYELFPTIGVSSYYIHNIKLGGKKSQIELGAKLPILGTLLAAPKYSPGYDASKFTFTSLHNMFNLQTQIWLNLPASKRFANRQFRFGYTWGLTRFARGSGNSLTLGNHTIQLISTLNRIK